MASAIELANVDKWYGPQRGVEGISLAVPEGSLFGFIGRNGAGKSTTIRILLGLITATRGEATLFGVSCTEPRARVGVGYVAGETDLEPGARVGSLLAYLGSFHAGDHRARRAELLKLFALDPSAKTDDLSLGNKRKVALIAALQHAPRLLVLDEPASGLDPVMRARLFDRLRDEVARGATVFLSSHILAEIELLCDRVAIIADGRLVTVDDVVALRKQTLRRVRTSFAEGGSGDALERLATRLDGVVNLERHGTAISFSYRGPMPPLLDALAAASPSDVQIEAPTLEDVFLADFTREVHRAA